MTCVLYVLFKLLCSVFLVFSVGCVVVVHSVYVVYSTQCSVLGVALVLGKLV